MISRRQFLPKCRVYRLPPTSLRLPDTALPDNDASGDEVAVLARFRTTTRAVQQRIPFTNLPPEIRNYIYELVLCSKEKDFIIAAPFYDELMSLGDQPPITQVARQLRSETLGIFYHDNTFIAYINNFDFTNLVRWAKCITSSPSAPAVRVKVKLRDHIRCAYQLVDLVRAWRDINGANIHLSIYGRYDVPLLTERAKEFDQRELVVNAIHVAEALREKGDFTETELIARCYGRFENIDREYLGSKAWDVTKSYVWEGIGRYHGYNCWGCF